jgi:hypothetical protein
MEVCSRHLYELAPLLEIDWEVLEECKIFNRARLPNCKQAALIR